MEQKVNFFSFDLASFEDYIQEQFGAKKFNARQVFDWVYRKWSLDIDSWSNVSKKLKENLKEDLDWSLPKIVWKGLSKDGTRKFLLALEDEQTIESVVIPATGRSTLCISSQVGCAIGCNFCHTGTQGLKRHLKIEEVVGQFVAVSHFLISQGLIAPTLSNIVYMGQGEPLHNYNAVKRATEIFMEPLGIGLGQRRITLSTSGLVPQIEKLIDFPPVNIAISLHSPNDETRSELMPINKVYDLERLFKAIKSIPLKAHRYITYEYLLIAGVNDREVDIDDLCSLLHIKESKISLIPFHEYPGSDYKKPSKSKVLWFRDELAKRGYICTIRQTKGEDILAACGQLKSAVEEDPNLWS